MVTKIWQIINACLLGAVGTFIFLGNVDYAQKAFTVFFLSVVCYIFLSPDDPLYPQETWQDLLRGSVAYSHLALGHTGAAQDEWPFTWDMDKDEKNAAYNAFQMAHTAAMRKGA